jgi:osmotically-inducible protein OsmY
MPTAVLPQLRAKELLSQSPQPLLRRLRVVETDDEVVLQGIVPSYFLKQLAQETVRPIVGARQLVNQIEVI